MAALASSIVLLAQVPSKLDESLSGWPISIAVGVYLFRATIQSVSELRGRFGNKSGAGRAGDGIGSATAGERNDLCTNHDRKLATLETRLESYMLDTNRRLDELRDNQKNGFTELRNQIFTNFTELREEIKKRR